MWAVELKNLRFAYEGGESVFEGADLRIATGSRTLLIGGNGTGKSTLLRLLAGRHLLPEESLRVFGKSPFHDPGVSQRIGWVDGDFPLTVDLTVGELLEYPSPGVDPGAEKQLVDLLEIDRSWRMCRVSEGQRRRVQLLLALRKPVELLLLDEVTSHLDIIVRADLLAWLRERSERLGTTIIYATHILDGAGDWATQIAFLRYRKPILLKPRVEIGEPAGASLLSLAELWIRNGRANFRKE